MESRTSKVILAVTAFILLIVIVAGLFFLASGSVGNTGLLLAYIAGLSMIFLPCTLPLVFIIVPLTMGEKPMKGLGMALLFGLGISITLAIYGVLTASIGLSLGVDKATRIMFSIAGLAAIIFGLSQLNLIRFTIPGLSSATPSWIQNKKDYTKIFFLGLFLGNAGIGCPNPAFYVLLTYIASVGSLTAGGWLAFIHGVGRATPLIFLAILGILGINSMKWVSTKKSSIDKLMGWGLVFVGVFIFAFGFFGMAWWEGGPVHESWNNAIFKIAPNLAEAEGHDLLVSNGFLQGPLWSGWVFVLITLLAIIDWYIWKKLKQKK